MQFATFECVWRQKSENTPGLLQFNKTGSLSIQNSVRNIDKISKIYLLFTDSLILKLEFMSFKNCLPLKLIFALHLYRYLARFYAGLSAVGLHPALDLVLPDIKRIDFLKIRRFIL